jgi:hypothetical protein
MMFAMRTGDRDRGAAGVVGLSTDGLKQQRSAGNRLTMTVRLSQTREQASPVEHQGDAARHQQRLRSCVVNPPQPHRFFNSSKFGAFGLLKYSGQLETGCQTVHPASGTQ